MAKTIRDEDLRLNIIINGDNGRKQMGELERAIHDTNSKLETLYQKRKKMEEQGKQDTQAYRNLSAQIGKHTKAIDGYRERLAALHRQQSINTMTLSELTSHINLVRAQLSKVDPGTPLWKQLNAELKKSSARLAELRAQAKATGGTICTMAERANRYIGLITAGFASLTAVFSGVSRAKQAFQAWDEAIANAMKTTQLSREEMLELDKALKNLDTRTSQNDLLGLARTAGKLGIEGKDNILQFVSAADKINIALGEDLGDNAEEALREIGKLVDIFSLDTDYGIEQAMLKVGSTINSLGMASTANEGYIVNFTKRIAGIAPNADISIDKVLGLAATLDKYGQMSETAATAVGQTITGMYKRTEEFARVARMSFGDFKELLEKDANEAFLRVLEGMNRGGEGMTTVVQALDSLHLNGQRASTVLGSLAAHSDELRNQQLLANQAFVDGSSVIEECNIKNETATAIMEKRKKAIVDEAVELGQTLTPAINVSLSAGTWLLKGMSALVTVGIKYRSILFALGAAYLTNVGLKKAHVAWTKLQVFWSAANKTALANEAAGLAGATSGTMLLCSAKNLLVGNLKAAGLAFKSFWASMGPIGWITLAISTLVGVIVALRGRTQEAVQPMTALQRANQDLAEALKNNDQGLGESIITIKKLSGEWKSLGGNLQEQKKFIENNQSAFADLGVAVTDVKYHNYFWNLSDTPVTPAVKVVSILGDITNKLAISEKIKGLIENLAVIATHRSRPLCMSGLQQAGNGSLILPVADMLPECTILDLIVNITKMYCASIFRDGDGFIMLTNKEILSSSEVLVWDDKISKEISMSTEPASSYTFNFANDGESSLSTETEAGTTEETEAEIKDVVGSIEALKTMISAGPSYTTVRENRTGNIYSGRELTVSGKELSYHDVLLHCDNKVATNEELEGSFDNSVNFKRVECMPLLILDRNNTRTSPKTYHMCPVVESPAPCSDRPTDVWIGSLINGQLVGKGYAFRRQTKSGENVSYNGIESSNAKLSLDVPVLYRRYHSQFAKWLSTNRRVVTTDVILTLSEISKLRMYDKICVCNQYFLIKKITHTFSQLFKTVSSRVELIACDNIHNEVEERNLVTIIEQSNGTVKAFWAKAEYPVETDILIQVKYEVDNQLSSSVEERETILRIFKGKTTSATIFGKLRSLPLITPTEDWRYYYTDYIEM